jgi:hypothetical protein
MTIRSAWNSILVLVGAGACTPGALGTLPRPSSPQPASPKLSVKVSDVGPWAFAYTSDTIRLQVNRSAAIESQTDSGIHREISTNNTDEILTLVVNADTVRYTATVDTFSTASQGLISSAAPVNLPVQISGVIDSASITPDSTNASTCDPVQSNLETDVRNVLVGFPRELVAGLVWRDSTTRTSCYATIPLRATVVRRFSVVGVTAFNGQTAVAIQRVDTISARGEGRQQQHQLVIETSGTGDATYLVSPELGRLLHLTTTQDLEFTIRASGRTSRFRETAKEEFKPVP